MGIFPLFAVAVALPSATPAAAALTAPEKRMIATVEGRAGGNPDEAGWQASPRQDIKVCSDEPSAIRRGCLTLRKAQDTGINC